MTSKLKNFVHMLEVDHPEGLTQTEIFLNVGISISSTVLSALNRVNSLPSRTMTFVLYHHTIVHGSIGTLSLCMCYPLRPAFVLSASRHRTLSLSFVNSWVADCFNINTWMIVSSMVGAGLSWWQAWICVWLGYGFVSPFIVLNARPGAIHHITFPVVARTSFGIWGSLWCTFNRGAMACIWYGVQASIGGSCVLVFLRSMWPSVYNIRKQSSDFTPLFLSFWENDKKSDISSFSEPPPCERRNHDSRFYVLLPLLAHLAPSHLVPYT